MTTLFDAFISYGRADSKAFAQNLQARLTQQGFNVWFDFNDIPLAVDFQNQIDDGIEKASYFLFIIAPHSVNSPYCLKEIELAVKLNKRIIPILHVMDISQETWQQRNPNSTESEWQAYKEKGLHESYQNMHPTIRKLNWVYFQEEINDFDASLTDLVKLLRSHTDYVQQHTDLLVKALEWERNQKQHSWLLVGEERQQAEAWLKIRFKDEQPPCLPTDLHCEYITESIKNANNLMTQVIIAYSDEDKATMEKIRRSLRRESITVWTNTTDIKTGESFEEAIKRGIEQADNLVYLISPDSIGSKYCQQELDLAVSLHKRIIPVLVRETPVEQIPPVLQGLQYIDLTDNVKEEDYHLDESQLLRILHQDEAYYREHKILLTKALKWKEQYSNPSILLRGYNLRSAEAWLKVAQKRTQHPPTALQEEFITESLRQPPLESLDVFISYSRADSDLARKLNEALQMQGKTTWFDQESIASGSDFHHEIQAGIKACDNFLFILSPRSVNSPYCADEVDYAASLNKRFITVLHQPVDSADLHPELAKIQWIDFNQNQREFNANFNQLIRALDTDREHVRLHSKWSQRALEWQQHDKSDDLLLRGNELAIAQDWLQETNQSRKKPSATDLQQALIQASLAAKEAHWRQEESRRKRELKQARRIIVVSVTALIGLMGLTSLAVVQWRESEQRMAGQIDALSRFSQILVKSNLKFDALIEGIRAGALLKKSNSENLESEKRIFNSLQTVIYESKFRERNRLTGHKEAVYSVVFSPDGKTIASASGDKTVRLWNQQGELLHTLSGHEDEVISVVFSPDGKTIASASYDKTLRLWNLEGELLHTLSGHEDDVNSVVFSPDGKTIASASDDGTVRLWNLEGKLLHTLYGHEDLVGRVVFSPDGKTIASSSSDKTVRLWNREGELLHTLSGHEETVMRVVFNPDGKTIASASSDKTVRLWNREGELLHILSGHEEPLWSVVFSPDGKTIASASEDKTVRLWNQQGELLHTLSGHEDDVNSVVFSPDGNTIASASWDKTVRLWNRKGELLHILSGHEDGVYSVVFSPDENTIASASEDKTVRLWNQQGELLHTLSGHEEGVNSVVFSPDGNTIASASEDKTVRLWNQQGELLHSLSGHEEPVISVVFSPDGNTIASASGDKTVRLWNREGELLHTLSGHEETVWRVVFSPDGKTIASASGDKTVRLWNREGELLHSLSGHESWVNSVVFSPDGKTIASASGDNTVRLWNQQGELLHSLSGHQETVWSVVFSPDGKTIASASRDKTVRLWNLEDLTLDALMHRACDWVGDYLQYNAPKSDQPLCDNVGQ
ncbi:TIR domain-containing protein [Coleofasciculus chthonoplastes]|uniref:TIR domain-containing protein n=1 Tax=Coleofasciculus chthonoplastes TaxID=64178 RepID=UPI0032F50739